MSPRRALLPIVAITGVTASSNACCAAADPLLVYGGEEGHRGGDYAVLSWRAVGCE